MDGEITGKRKVKIFDSMTDDCIIILTDASEESIRQWITDRKNELKEGKNTGFGALKKYYIKVLHSSEDDPKDDADAIGYDESYRTNTIRVKPDTCTEEKEKRPWQLFMKLCRGINLDTTIKEGD